MQRSDAFLVDAQGRRIPVGDRFVIGRSREADLVINSARVTRHHAVLTRLVNDAYEVADYGSTNGTFIEGERIDARRLVPGDWLQVDGNLWRFERGDAAPPAPVDDAAELLLRAGDDEAAFTVALDALLERGEPLAQRLVEGAPWVLTPELAAAERDGSLLLERRRGAPVRARIRPHSFLEERALLFALTSTEAGRLLTSLTLPRWSPRWGLDGAQLPALRQLRFGPHFSKTAAEACAHALAEVNWSGMPALERPEVESYDKAWLDFGAGQQRPLSQGRQESFTSFSVRWEDGVWLARLELMTQRLLINRVSRAAQVLLPGDALRSGNITCTFRAE